MLNSSRRRPGSPVMGRACVIASIFVSYFGTLRPTAAAFTQPSPIQIEGFGPASPYAVGQQSITLVGTVKNAGAAAIPEGAVSLRLYALAGLDYTAGDTVPKLPEMTPGGVTTFRWKLTPIRDSGPLVAALAVDVSGQPPVVRVISVPRLVSDPSSDAPTISKTATARIGRNGSVLENSKVRLRVVQTEARAPLVLFSTRTAGGWRQVGVCAPLAEARAGEGGQRHWWEVFKVEEEKATVAKDLATLSLSGVIGLRWRATVDFTARLDSAVVDVRLRLSPNRPVRLSGLRLCPLLAGAGSFGASCSEQLDPVSSGPNVVSAVRWGEITIGVLREGSPPFPDWVTSNAPPLRGADYLVLGAESVARDNPVLLQSGALVEMRARLFALAPSASVQDAMRITFPPDPAGR